ncbi:HSF_DNA-bind domain-containing protein [Cephalotus follicularis]|uniref:HSF_DNA-bind domain-containing protein n=1 Tax=Cephalotus follicularis TaxID=3775 RepID=A0A1Q3AT99_CEPFO|nr:HSF_DNA-bind domain-containing protein [Cephalotus follicularis]
MEVGPPSGSGGGGPAPFLLKTYDMVDDSSTDEIVSWSSNNNSFVVWNPPEFARLLLPTYFKHNNFSSFIRQLNTYGFRKIDPEKWEFANDDFVKHQKHLLKNIHRRKPIHSHSHPQGSLVDSERATFEDEIERLSREKASLEAKVLKAKQERSVEKLHLEDLVQRVEKMGRRQENLLTFLKKAIQNRPFVDHLAKKIDSMDVAAYNKKRRLPQVDQSNPLTDNSFVDNHSSSRPEFGKIIHQDFSNKLRLELSPAVSDINLVSDSTQSSNEDGESPQKKTSDGALKAAQKRTEGLLFAPEPFELSDSGTSLTFKMDSSLLRKVPANESPRQQCYQQNLISIEEVDGQVSCHLNLSLASSSLQIHRSPYSARMTQPVQEPRKSPESRYDANGKESDIAFFPKSRNQGDGDATLSSSQEALNNNQGPPTAAQGNDVFWEQFLTERPGSLDNEEASSTYRASPCVEQEDRRSGQGLCRNSKNMEQLTL